MDSLVAEHVLWLEASRYSDSTVRSRRRNLRHFVAWCAAFGISHPGELTLPLLEGYRHALYQRRKANGEPLGFGDQTQKLVAVKRFLRWAARMRVTARDAGAALELPRRPQQLPRAVLSVTEVEQVLATPDVAEPLGLRDRAILEILYSTGIRRMEVINLRLADVDGERGVVCVRQGKGRKDRVVPIGDRALGWLQRYVNDVRVSHVGALDPGHVFLTRRGRPLRANRLTELVHRYVVEARLLKTGSCHLLRHTMATLMLEHGADVRYLQALLGHAQLSTTAIYTHVSIVQLKAVHLRTHPANTPAPSQSAARQEQEEPSPELPMTE